MSGIKLSAKGGRKSLERVGAIDKKLRKAVLMAMNDTGESLRSNILKDMSGEVNIKRPVIRDRVRLTKARRLGDVVRIWALKKGLVLSHFPHKQLYEKQKGGKRRKAGVRVNVSGQTKVLPGAFIVKTLGSGSTDGLIFVREGPKRSLEERRGAGAYGADLLRQPIRALYGPSPSQILETRKPDYEVEGDRILDREIRRQIERAKL